MVIHNKNKKTLIFVIIISVLSIITIILLNKNKTKTIKIISYGNDDKSCLVEQTNLSKEQIIDKYKTYEYIKIDEVIEKQKVNIEKLKNKIKSSSKTQFFCYGIAFDEEFNQFLLKEEITANDFIDYEEYELKLDEINDYFIEQGKQEIDILTEQVWLFKTESYYYENGQWISLLEESQYNLREFCSENLSTKIELASERIMSLKLDNGQYIYGLQTNTNQELDGYNILRHAGTTWSQILAYKENPSEKLKNSIQISIDFLINNYIIIYDENINYVVENESDEIKLGGNALTLLMLVQYKETFNDDKYIEIMHKIANGIISMQNEDGSFNHVYNLDFSLKEKNRTVYYDGESIYSLMKYYEFTKREDVYKVVTKTIDYLIEQKYWQYADHWIAYGLNEYLKHNHANKYIEFALDNYEKNKAYINNITKFNPTSVEMLLATYKTYLYIKGIDANNKVVQEFNVENLKGSINKRMNNLYSYYIYPEVAMYLNNPSQVIYGFHNIEHRMRIDDIQHSLAATILYKELETYL